MSGLNLESVVLTNTRFDRADLRNANLFAAHLAVDSFRGADLTEAMLRKANVTDANFSGALMRRANLTRTDAWRANFAGADLTGAELWKLFAHGADLRGAILRDVDFRLSPAHFDDCLFAGADLSGATGQLLPSCQINVGSPDAPEVISGEPMLEWFRRAGAKGITWYAPGR